MAKFLPGKLTFCGVVLKTRACVALVRKAGAEIKIAFFFQIVQSKENI